MKFTLRKTPPRKHFITLIHRLVYSSMLVPKWFTVLYTVDEGRTLNTEISSLLHLLRSIVFTLPINFIVSDNEFFFLGRIRLYEKERIINKTYTSDKRPFVKESLQITLLIIYYLFKYKMWGHYFIK